MYYFAAAQQASPVELATFFLRFQTKGRVLSITKSEITGKNAFNGDLFQIEDNHESSKDRRI